MAIFALSDLHLAISEPSKSMEEFGPSWDNYMERIRQGFLESVSKDDYVLLPGDLSWASSMDNAYDDFMFIENLPGKKIICRGNHDYYWGTLSKMERYLSEKSISTISIIRNNSIHVENSLITGTRGWKLPSDISFGEEDKKIYEREIVRTRICLESLRKEDPEHKLRWIFMMHFPPLLTINTRTEFTKLFEEYDVDICIYGHLHGIAQARAYEGKIDGMGPKYCFVSGDHLGFKPFRL